MPAHITRLVEAAHERGADGVILDVEDSVPQDQKGQARRQLPESMAKVGRKGGSVLVRVNRGWRALAADLDAAVMAVLTSAIDVARENIVSLFHQALPLCELTRLIRDSEADLLDHQAGHQQADPHGNYSNRPHRPPGCGG
ncbi:aldolase/citrate lyase family protein [Mesorhizobium sp. M0622]|uniref:aldolase/citrate lyase family protein n=1 Tax=Mesorhizobium sp. M0622 TaxID=2956975 RepID=UPI0033373F17